MAKITARMGWLEKQIKIQEDALVRTTDATMMATHSYLLKKLSDEWAMRTAKGEISYATAMLGGED